MGSSRRVEVFARSDYFDRPDSDKDTTIFSGELADAVFSNKLIKVPLPYGWGPGDVKEKYDSYNSYTLNSYNCRGPEFSSGVDFIFAGCSQTFGIGVPDDGVWPKFVAENLNSTYANLSMLGAGMEWITDSIYRYVNTFGKPNRGIIVLAPDYYRVDVLVDNILNSCDRHRVTDYVPQYYDDNNLDFRLVTCHLDNSYPVSYMKKPFSVSHTMLEAEALRRSIKAVRDLEIFCEQAGIPLIWSTWHEGLDRLATNLTDEYRFKNYLPTNNLRWQSKMSDLPLPDTDEYDICYYLVDRNGESISCHSDLESEFGLAFHKGTDRFKFEKRDQSHMGVHEHIHLAEAFTQKALEIGM
jgi:hypothetical protein